MNKQEIQGHFRSGDIPTERQFAEWIERCVIWLDDYAELPEPCPALSGTCYLIGGRDIARCSLVEGRWKWTVQGTGGTFTSSYLGLSDKPRINGFTLNGKVTLKDIGAMPAFDGLGAFKELEGGVRIVVGVVSDTGEVTSFQTTLAELKRFLGGGGSAESGCRVAIGFKGKTDGVNRFFDTELEFAKGTSALYLNGQRMYPGHDYTECAGKGFETAKAPDGNDRILFEAVPV